MGKEWHGIALPRGVEVRDEKGRQPSVRISFPYLNVRCRELSLLLDPAKKAECRKAIDLAGARYVEVMQAIELGKFSYGDFFPESKNCARFGEFSTAGLMFSAIKEEWLQYSENKLERITWEYYGRILKRKAFAEKWDRRTVRSIKAQDVLDWITLELAPAGIVLKSVSNILIPYRNIFDRAIPKYNLPSNPFRVVALAKNWPKNQRKTEYDPEPFTDDEINAIVSKAGEHWANQARFWQWTGLRPQEIVALKWEAVNFVEGGFWVREVNSLGETLQRTKTAAGHRFVKLLPEAEAALQRQKQLTQTQEFVFINPVTMKPWNAVSAMTNYQWRSILKRAGVSYRPPEQLRHTFGAKMAANGEDWLWIQAMMGHKNVMTTQKHYLRFQGKRELRTIAYQPRGNYSALPVVNKGTKNGTD